MEEKRRILIEDWSPICHAQAFVEETNSCTYFYIWFNPGSEESGVKSCWICNTTDAPQELNLEEMQEGEAPSMPEYNVLHEKSGIQLNSEALEIVWFEEGESAALLENGKLLSVIPSWSGLNSFHGYSRYAKEEHLLAWPLQEAEEILMERVERSKSFWASFDEEGQYWEQAQNMHIEVLQHFFGEYKKYYALDRGEFPPKAYITGEKDGICYGISAGISLMCMPKVEMYYQEEARDYRRIEIGFATLKKHEPLLEIIGAFISGISNMPWQELTFLGHGHTIPYTNIKGYSAIWFVNTKALPQIIVPTYPKVMGEDVNLLWAIPVTEAEYQWLLEHPIEEALQNCSNVEWLHVFDGVRKIEW